MGPSSKPFSPSTSVFAELRHFLFFFMVEMQPAGEHLKEVREMWTRGCWPCRSCRDDQGILVSSTMLASLAFLALPSLWINICQHCLFLLCQACLLGCPTHSSECGQEEDPRSSTLEFFIPRPAWPVSGTEAQHPPLPGLGTSQGVCWGSLGGQCTHTWASSRAK